MASIPFFSSRRYFLSVEFRIWIGQEASASSRALSLFHLPFRHFQLTIFTSLASISGNPKLDILHPHRYRANSISDPGNRYDEAGSDHKLVLADGGMDVTLRNIVLAV